MDRSRIGCRHCVMYVPSLPSPLSPFPLLSLFCFLQPAWFLLVGGDRSFKLALKEENEEFSDELREECEVRGEGEEGREGRGEDERRGGEGREGGRGSQSMRWF